MGSVNIKRLKSQFKFRESDKTTDKYLKIIDLIYYEKISYITIYDKKRDILTLFFKNKDIIKINMEELRNLLLFLLTLSLDIDEQLFNFAEINKGKIKKIG